MKYICLLLPMVLVACGGISEISHQEEVMTESRLPLIDPRGGQLCVFRVYNLTGSMVAYSIKADDEYIGRLSNDSYFCVNLTPGEYVINGDTTHFGSQRVAAEVKIKQGMRKFMELQVGYSSVLSNQTQSIGLAGIYSVMN
ncbi:hypothetical protein LJC18_04655 [Lachnospiraceae bacterium OttesenSCG-928-E19]|nr:hypothetical protein [Lachnospiraceae bacterium OttesenSCG-928-E19]